VSVGGDDSTAGGDTGSGDTGSGDTASGDDTAGDTPVVPPERLRRIEAEPLDTRAAAYSRINDELQAALEGGDTPRS